MSNQDWADELSSDTDPGTPGRLYFANVDEFVRMYLLPNWRRKPHNVAWCSHWWEHAEAISRLEALWESWEKLRLEPGTGMAVWWRDYADPHMAVLTDRDAGPFTKCDFTKGTHEVPEIWASAQPPTGLFREAWPVAFVVHQTPGRRTIARDAPPGSAGSLRKSDVTTDPQTAHIF